LNCLSLVLALLSVLALHAWGRISPWGVQRVALRKTSFLVRSPRHQPRQIPFSAPNVASVNMIYATTCCCNSFPSFQCQDQTIHICRECYYQSRLVRCLSGSKHPVVCLLEHLRCLAPLSSYLLVSLSLEGDLWWRQRHRGIHLHWHHVTTPYLCSYLNPSQAILQDALTRAAGCRSSAFRYL
jgi:hypothetical protein